MRMLKKNKQEMYFSNFTGSQPIYERNADGSIAYDSYVDKDGNVQTYPRDTGRVTSGYSSPTKFEANIVMSGGDAEAKEFGLDISQYSAVLKCEKGLVNIDETSLIWFQSEVGYKDIAKTEIEPNSADYRVVKVSPSLNGITYVLQRVVKNGTT